MKGKRGFTLVELVVGLLLLSLAWTVTVGILGNIFRSTETLTSQMEVESNIRHLVLILEKQIKHSDRIVFAQDKVYLRDLESPTYLNYYSLEGTNLYKNKVYDTLKSIGLGGKSQTTANLTAFQLVPSGDGQVTLSVKGTWMGQVFGISKTIHVTCPVYYIG